MPSTWRTPPTGPFSLSWVVGERNTQDHGADLTNGGSHGSPRLYPLPPFVECPHQCSAALPRYSESNAHHLLVSNGAKLAASKVSLGSRLLGGEVATRREIVSGSRGCSSRLTRARAGVGEIVQGFVLLVALICPCRSCHLRRVAGTGRSQASSTSGSKKMLQEGARHNNRCIAWSAGASWGGATSARRTRTSARSIPARRFMWCTGQAPQS